MFAIFFRYLDETDSHSKVRVGHAHFSGGLDPETVNLEALS